MRIGSSKRGHKRRQGDLEDCWVVSAITILATVDSALIKNMFLDQHVQPSGKYTVRIHFHNEPKIVELDDYFPCYTYTVELW